MFPHIESNQYTLKQTVNCSGVGLHTGKTVHLRLNPAPANTGICFRRVDVAGRPLIPARVDRVVDTTLATTIGDGINRISTTEHLMAALRGMGIDNALVELDAHEVPIMDGSAGPFLQMLEQGGRRRQQARRRMLHITRSLEYSVEGKSIRVEPYDGFKVSGRIHFEDELISEQCYSVEVNRERFTQEIAFARTFGYVEQVEQLWQKGLALGSSLDNVIAIHWNRRSVLNEDGLRFHDEFIRHKVLDIIGDMALLGAPLLAHVIADCSGHSLHLALMQTIMDNPDHWEYVSYQEKGQDCKDKRHQLESFSACPAFFPSPAEVRLSLCTH